MSGYGHNNFRKAQPPHREPQSEEHTLDPWIEDIIRGRPELSDFRSIGGGLNHGTHTFNTDSKRTALEIPRACMISVCGFAVPLTNEAYPAIKKLDTRFKDNWHHAIYQGPIPWDKDREWRHIPCYSRYVINRHGVVRNAYNGMQVLATYGKYELVADGRSNYLKKYIPAEELMMLSFSQLPDDFVDFRGGQYSHVVQFDKDSKVIGWVKRPTIKARDPQGTIHEVPTLLHLMNTVMDKYETRTNRDLKQCLWKGIPNGQIIVDGWAVKYANPAEAPVDLSTQIEFDQNATSAAPATEPATTPDSTPAPAPAPAPAPTTPAAPPADEGFDDDIPF